MEDVNELTEGLKIAERLREKMSLNTMDFFMFITGGIVIKSNLKTVDQLWEKEEDEDLAKNYIQWLRFEEKEDMKRLLFNGLVNDFGITFKSEECKDLWYISLSNATCKGYGLSIFYFG